MEKTERCGASVGWLKKPPRWGMSVFHAALLAVEDPANVSLYSRIWDTVRTLAELVIVHIVLK
jgi:hypothetical protein